MKILIRGTNWIGDSIMTIPAMREMRRIFPDARISLHTHAANEGLFSNAEFLDDIISFEKNRWPALDLYDNSTFLKDEGFDLALLFPNSFDSALTAFLSRIPQRIGYNKDLRGLLLTQPIAVPEWKNRRHEVYYYLNLVSETEKRMIGRDTVSRAEPDISLEISYERKEEARRTLIAAGVDPLRKTVLLGPGSTNSRAKQWPAARFAELCQRLDTDARLNVVLVGSKGDTEVAGVVSDIAGRSLIDLTGQTNIAEIAAIISVADLLISNDMGLAHIAPAVGTRSIVIFGPTNPVTTRPFSDSAVVVRHDVPCAPCMLRDCPIDHRCMTTITPANIFETAANLLAAEVTYEATCSVS